MSCAHPIGPRTSRKKADSWLNKGPITAATTPENLLKLFERTPIILHHWLRLILGPIFCHYCYKCFHNVSAVLFFPLPSIFFSQSWYFFRSILGKDMGAHSLFFAVLVFITLLRTRGVSFHAKNGAKVLIMYTGQICLMFQLRQWKDFLLLSGRIGRSCLFFRWGFGVYPDKDHLCLWPIHEFTM